MSKVLTRSPPPGCCITRGWDRRSSRSCYSPPRLAAHIPWSPGRTPSRSGRGTWCLWSLLQQDLFHLTAESVYSLQDICKICANTFPTEFVFVSQKESHRHRCCLTYSLYTSYHIGIHFQKCLGIRTICAKPTTEFGLSSFVFLKESHRRCLNFNILFTLQTSYRHSFSEMLVWCFFSKTSRVTAKLYCDLNSNK